MVINVPSVKLNNGKSMPVLGLGTWRLPGEEGKALIKAAIDAGYRHFDTAILYHSEQIIGEAIREKIADGTVKREDIFVTSKLWCSYAHPGIVIKGCQRSVENLGLGYIDLFLMHWPFSFKAIPNPDEPVRKTFANTRELFDIEEYFPRDASGNIEMTDTDYLDVWKEMEQCVHKGLVKSIGVSNFNSKQVERLIKEGSIKPVVNEVEFHPYLLQKKLVQFLKERDVHVVAFSPLSAGDLGVKQEPGTLLTEPKILKISKEVNKSPAQVILRYLIQLGAIVIPKTGNQKRLGENINVFDFTLSPQQMAEMESLNRNQRSCIMPGTEKHKYYPFNVEF